MMGMLDNTHPQTTRAQRGQELGEQGGFATAAVTRNAEHSRKAFFVEALCGGHEICFVVEISKRTFWVEIDHRKTLGAIPLRQTAVVARHEGV